jgi:hypothetical protein
MIYTHSWIRAQQRGMPPLTSSHSMRWAKGQHDGYDATILSLNKASVRRVEREMGRGPVARSSDLVDACKVKTKDGHAITVGEPCRGIWRKS